MRLLIIAATLAALAAGPVVAKEPTASSDKMKSCAASWNAMSAAEKKGMTYNEYTSKCMKGSTSPANKSAMSATTAAKPASATAGKTTTTTTTTSKSTTTTSAAGATAKCKDGTYSHAQSHSGACSNHGGVANWIK